MNLPLIQIDKKTAQAKLAAYRVQLKKRNDAEYHAALKGYAALAKGTPLLNLTDAFAFAGLGPDFLPKLAIARADRKQVKVTVNQHTLVFHAFNRNQWRETGSETLFRRIPFESQNHMETNNGYALIPMIPADARPNVSLADCFILWEVEHWADRPIRSTPDRDPYLLKHLAGDLYAVLAAWDLTDLERAIMQGRSA